MNRTLPLLLLCLTAACTGDDQEYPRLLPTQQILAEPTLPDHVPDAQADLDESLRAQGTATRARADAIPDPTDAGDLQARAADLRRRAEELRRADSDAEDCTSGPACPETTQP